MKSARPRKTTARWSYLHVEAQKLASKKWRIEQWLPEPGQGGEEEGMERGWLMGTGSSWIGRIPADILQQDEVTMADHKKWNI